MASSVVKAVLLEPLASGALLWALLRGPASLRVRILDPISSPSPPLPSWLRVRPATLVKTLKYLFALGLLRRLNRALTRWALDGWRLLPRDKPWDWPREVCVITGGSGGIGSELALRLASTGMKVAVLDLAPLPASLESLPNVRHFACDITDPASVDTAASEVRAAFGDPSILCNNAGICRVHGILDVPASHLDKIVRVNLVSNWYTVQAFLPAMIAAGKGHVVTTASMASFAAVAGAVDYCATKAGVMAFHEGLRQELKHRYAAPFVRTTAVHPSWVQTPLIGEWEAQLNSTGESIMTPQYVAGEIAAAILSGRSGQVVLPRGLIMSLGTGARGWPTWAHELVNDITRDAIRKIA